MHDRQRWLLIYDNAEDPQALASYLPGGAGRVLITSRNPDWDELATPVPVDVFTREESVSLLRARVPRLAEPDAKRVAEALEDLPLAVQQAAAFLAETGSTVETYLELLASRAAEVLAHGTPVTYRASLAASYLVAFDRLAIDEPAALDLLTLAAHLAPEPIPFTLFTAHPDLLPEPLVTTAGDPLAFASLTRALRRRALARISTDNMHLHRLVQAILLSHLIGGTAQDGVAAVALRLLRAAVPADPWNTRAPGWHGDNCSRTSSPSLVGTKSRPTTMSPGYLTAPPPTCSRRDHRNWPGLVRTGLRAVPAVARQGPPDTLTAASNLARDLHALGKYQQVRQLEDYVRTPPQGLTARVLDADCGNSGSDYSSLLRK